jgi:hypothetical protein
VVDGAQQSDAKDAARYRRLQILGCAPCYTEHLKKGEVMRFSNLDKYVDDDIAAHPSRGEAHARSPAANAFEEMPWPNGCNETIAHALRYLANNPRPVGGQDRFNSEHLEQLAAEIERMATFQLYRRRLGSAPTGAPSQPATNEEPK